MDPLLGDVAIKKTVSQESLKYVGLVSLLSLNIRVNHTHFWSSSFCKAFRERERQLSLPLFSPSLDKDFDLKLKQNKV